MPEKIDPSVVAQVFLEQLTLQKCTAWHEKGIDANPWHVSEVLAIRTSPSHNVFLEKSVWMRMRCVQNKPKSALFQFGLTPDKIEDTLNYCPFAAIEIQEENVAGNSGHLQFAFRVYGRSYGIHECDLGDRFVTQVRGLLQLAFARAMPTDG